MPRSPAPVTETITYEQALAELEGLVQAMEGAQLPLDQLLTSYRRGAELARYCQGRLANAEQEIRQLEGDLLKPLNPGELKGGTE